MSIGDRVKALRKANGLSRSDFAKSLGVSSGVIANIELQRTSGVESKKALFSLMCDKYGCRREWLIDGEGDMMQDLSREQEIIRAVSEMFTGDDGFRQDIISMLVKLPDEHWSLLADMAQRLLDEQKKRQG